MSYVVDEGYHVSPYALRESSEVKGMAFLVLGQNVPITLLTHSIRFIFVQHLRVHESTSLISNKIHYI